MNAQPKYDEHPSISRSFLAWFAGGGAAAGALLEVGKTLLSGGVSALALWGAVYAAVGLLIGLTSGVVALAVRRLAHSRGGTARERIAGSVVGALVVPSVIALVLTAGSGEPIFIGMVGAVVAVLAVAGVAVLVVRDARKGSSA